MMSPLATLWYFIIFAALFGFVVHFYPERLHRFLNGIFLYGKTSKDLVSMKDKRQSQDSVNVVLLRMMVPKSYFAHFYIFASVYAAVATCVLLINYYLQNSPERIVQWLDIAAGESRGTNASSVATIVAMLLYLLHVMRRTYESIYVSVYSSSSKINVMHYALGYIFYFGVVTSLLAGAPGFTSEGFHHKTFHQAYDWKLYQVFGTSLYFWAVWHQNKCANILANLRKDKKGKVVHRDHGIAKGDWFDLVSNPHYFAEILIYVALNIILEFQNGLVILAFLFTVANQVILALMNHKWYRATYSDYPKDRKAIIPFIL